MTPVELVLTLGVLAAVRAFRHLRHHAIEGRVLPLWAVWLRLFFLA